MFKIPNAFSSFHSTISLSSFISTMQAPIIVRDPRYVAGRATIGQQAAVDIFQTLLQKVIERYGDNSNSTSRVGRSIFDDVESESDCETEHIHSLIETAPAYYEYGNALLRLALRQRQQQQQHDEEEEEGGTSALTSTLPDSKPTAIQRNMMAAAAEQRRQSNVTINDTTKSSDVKSSGGTTISTNDLEKDDATTTTDATNTATLEEQEEDEEGDDDEESNDEQEEDLLLALEMMETAWSIFDAYQQEHMTSTGSTNTTESDCDGSTTSSHKYQKWVTEQIPRVLTGIGDTFAAMYRHADSVDAYLRALDHRQTRLNQYLEQSQQSTTSSTVASVPAASKLKNNIGNSDDMQSQLQLLTYRRQVVEATILVVEELLECGNEQDVQTTEGQIILVSKGNVIEYARGYYDRAREELQETVVLLGQIVAMIPLQASSNTTTATTAIPTSSTTIEKAIQEEKENVCYVATMVMGAGTALAEMDEHADAAASITKHNAGARTGEPKQKKAKP
jgi:hypothetical protein